MYGQTFTRPDIHPCVVQDVVPIGAAALSENNLDARGPDLVRFILYSAPIHSERGRTLSPVEPPCVRP